MEHVDPAKEARAQALRLSNNTTTLAQEYARQGRDWEEELRQRARELELMPTTEGGLDYRLNMTHAMDGYPGVEHTMPIWPAFDDVVELFATAGTVTMRPATNVARIPLPGPFNPRASAESTAATSESPRPRE
jgi:hypothetical protein